MLRKYSKYIKAHHELFQVGFFLNLDVNEEKTIYGNPLIFY